MDTIADSEPVEEASPDDGEDDWLEPGDVADIQAAIDASDIIRSRRGNGWTSALVASTLFHIALISAAATILSGIQSTFHWRVARGSPAAQNGMSIRNLPDESDSMDPPSIASPPMPARAEIHQAAVADAAEDASVLPDQLLPPPAIPDPVIGIGSSPTSDAIPRFVARKLPVQLAGATVSNSSPKSPSSGVSTPPRVAGPRGQRDGFDSRGLPIPDYPPESRRRGEEGVVVVDVEVLPDGSVGSIRVVSDAGHPRLAAAAVEKLKTATFEPARQDGKQVVGHVLIPYRFTLE